jgi:hypothetical protein
MSTTPASITLNELAPQPRWVAWQAQERDPGKPPTKVPYAPRNGHQARADDPRTWGTRAAAESRAGSLPKPFGIGGVGIEFGELADGICLGGVDLDSCLNAEGVLEPWAAEVLDRLGTYSEVSPSGTGVKGFFTYRAVDLAAIRAAMGTAHGKQFKRGGGEHPPAIELHISNRYFAVTDEHLAGTPDALCLVSLTTLLWLIREAGPAFVGRPPAATGGACYALLPSKAQLRPDGFGQPQQGVNAMPDDPFYRPNGLAQDAGSASHENGRQPLPPWEDDAPDDGQGKPFPMHLKDAWDALGSARHNIIVGPWRDKPTLNYRARTDECVRALRHNGWTLEWVIEIAGWASEGLGKLSHHADLIRELWQERTAELLKEAQEKAEADEAEKARFVPKPWVYRDPKTIPPREWLVGNVLLRGYATVLGASGGVGKTAYAIALVLAFITGRSDIIGEHVFTTGNAWLVTLEDDRVELERRVATAMIAHGIKPGEIAGRLFINSADERPLLLAKTDETGTFVVCEDAQALADGIRTMRIGVTIIDPLVKSHAVIENSNEHMDRLIGMANDTARITNSSVALAAHFRKGGGDDGARDAIRGGGALIDGARIARTLTPLTPEEATALKVGDPSLGGS